MIESSELPPAGEVTALPWSQQGKVFRGGLPSWMAPSPEDASSLAPGEDDEPPARSTTIRPSAPPPSKPVMVSFRPPTMPPPARDYEGEIAALQQQLDACLRSMTRLRRRVLEASERQLVELALAMAERVVGRELEGDPTIVARWVKEAVEALASEDTLSVVVSPDIGDVLTEIEVWLGERQVRIVVDDALEPSSCEVRGDMAKVDASLRARIAAMGETLGIREEDDVRS